MGKVGDAAVPAHQETVLTFWIQEREVTNREFAQFKKHQRVAESDTDNQPAGGVSKADAIAFAKFMSKKDRKNYRLPTEAEWEFAARGGLKEKEYPWGNEEPFDRACIFTDRTKEVGSYPPNGYGLYDMAGNVTEWVSDAFWEYGKPKDPNSAKAKAFWLSRGGSFTDTLCHVYFRELHPTDLPAMPSNGFRLAYSD